MARLQTKKQKTLQSAQERSELRVLWFKNISIQDIPLVGGKNASLGEMYSKLADEGVRIPNGFAVTAAAYWEFMEKAGLKKDIKEALKGLDVTDVTMLAKVGKKIRTLILSARIPQEIEREIILNYRELGKQRKEKTPAVAVRSSATAEDLPDASFAGQQETYLNVRGEKALLLAVKQCVASLFTDRALSYREIKGFDHLQVALSVTVQEMVHADTGTSGVMFTMDTESGFRGVTLVTASYGLGEYVVKGRVIPDQFYVFKKGLEQGKNAIISRTLGTKQVKLVYGKTGGTRQARVSTKDKETFCITNDDVVTLAKWGSLIEKHYNKPQDIEWAKDGKTGTLYIVQARPETVQARNNHQVIEKYELKQSGKELLRGIAVGQKIGAGKVRVIEKPADMKKFKKGEILVTRITDPDWEPIMRIAAAIVTEQGGKTSHAAIVSRELGVPCIVGAVSARKLLKSGESVTVSCIGGDEGIIYKGALPFEVKKIEVGDIPNTKTKMMMNVGDPDHAFALSFLPHDGVGLARQEFIFSNFIRIHPLALLNYNKLKDKNVKKKIDAMTIGYKNKADFCVDRLAEGVGRIATAMYPKPVVVRLSDFKTNEYATLIGGKEFEPKEENPMLGWRGASRYYSSEYKAAFELECKALKKARDEWGLTNIIVMVPFCRTPEEGQKVLSTMEEFGLKRGENGLEVYVMCEIPSNVILADDFAKMFDGFSIGSNDLTQLTLGVDRDSSLVANVYDENNEAIKKLIREVIRVAHKHKRKVGICGQAPSDYPEFADFLVREGIDSISLNPDTIIETKKRIAALEKTGGGKSGKTNGKFLSIVATIGVMAASFIGLGAGCIGNNILSPSTTPSEQTLSPAQIREKMEENIKNDRALTNTFTTRTFAEFSISYPKHWVITEWNGGVMMRDPLSNDYVSIFRQVIGHPVPEENKQTIEVDRKRGVRYSDALPTDGSLVEVAEIVDREGSVLEINGRTDRFTEILNSLRFLPAASGEGTGGSEGFCIQVITYARPADGGSCVMYPTPCDVPEGWQVCGPQDVTTTE